MFSADEVRINLGLGYVAGGGKRLDNPTPSETYTYITDSISRSAILKDKFDIVWGPTSFSINVPELTPRTDDHVVFIARNKEQKNDYRLVIRGAQTSNNFLEGLFILPQVDWSKLDNYSETGMMVSYGLYLAMDNIINNINNDNEGKGVTVIDFIKSLTNDTDEINITVTGNSLGGGISTPLMVYLKNYFINNGYEEKIKFHCCKFSAPTFTSKAFATYALEIINMSGLNPEIYISNYFSLRNDNDLVPCLWNPEELTAFLPRYDNVSPLSDEFKGILQALATVIMALPDNNRYQQISTTEHFEHALIDTDSSLTQIGNQHGCYHEYFSLTSEDVSKDSANTYDITVVVN